MDETIPELEELLRRLKAHKRPNGTRIHYATLKLARLRAREPLVQKKSAKTPRPKAKKEKPVRVFQAKPSPENRAYVLSKEVYDLTQAIVALERMR